MPKALFIFHGKFPQNAILNVEGPVELKDSKIDVGGISQVTAILNGRKKGVRESFGAAVAGFTSLIVGILPGGDGTADQLAYAQAIVQWPEGEEKKSRTWKFAWEKKSENIVSIFVLNRISPQCIADAVREHLHTGLRSSHTATVLQLICDFLETKRISVSVAPDESTPPSFLSLRNLINNEIPVLEDLLGAPLTDASSYVGRSLLASSESAMDLIKETKFATIIAECAVQDLTYLVTRQALEKNITYAHVPKELWDAICDACKLAIASALAAFNIRIPLSLLATVSSKGRLGGYARRDGWEDGESRERFEAAVDLAIQVDGARRRLRSSSTNPPIPSEWHIIGPYSAAVASILLGERSPGLVEGLWLWEEAGPDRLATAVRVALEVLTNRAHEAGQSQQASHRWLDNFRALAASHAVDTVRKLGPARAAAVFLNAIPRERICKIVVAAIREGAGWDLQRVCINLWEQIGLSLEGDGELWQLLVNAVLNDKNPCMEQGVKKACIQAICGHEAFAGTKPSNTVTKSVQVKALSMLRRASQDVFQTALIQHHRLHEVQGAHKEVIWDCILGSDFPAVTLAVAIAENWLVRGGGPIAFSSSNAFVYYSRDMQDWCPAKLRVGDTEAATFLSIFSFAVRVPAGARAMEVFRRHNGWAKKVLDAAKARDPVGALVTSLSQTKTSIPVSFLRFLAEVSSSVQADSSGMVCIHSVYRMQLIGENAMNLDQFLPATDVAHNKSEAMKKLNNWLDRTIRKERDAGAAEKLKARFDALKDRLDAANLSTFPDCARAASTEDQTLADAVNVFMSDAHRCDLFDCKARELFRGLTPAQDPLSVPAKALRKARETLEGAFAGRIHHEQVRMSARVLTANNPEMQKEAGALWALLGKPERPQPFSADDPIMVYLRLVLLDPGSLVRWAGELRLFAMAMLAVESLPAIDGFLSVYGGQDTRTLKLFSEPVDPCTVGLNPGDVPNSVYHMLSVFQRDLVFGAPQQSWQLIEDLRHTGPLLEALRSRVRSRQDLKCKMDSLRMMCVSNRHMSRPVDALDGLADRLLDLLQCNRNEADILQHIGHLLKSGALSKAAAESISISELSHLFSYVDSGDDTAKRNARLLRTANIVIDLELLVGIAQDSFATSSALDTVSVKIAQQGSNVLAFRLAGGRMERTVTGAEIEALFIETSVQLSVLPKNSQADDARDGNEALKEAVEVSRIRTCKVVELAEKLYEFARLGWISTNRHLEFGSQTPETTRSVWDESNRVYGPVFDIEDHMRKYSHSDNLSSKFKNVRDIVPWISFCPPLHVMQGTETPWIKALAHISSEPAVSGGETLLSAVAPESLKDIVEWLNRRAGPFDRKHSSDLHNSQHRENHLSLKSTIIACSSMNGSEDCSMIRSLGLLEAIGESPPRATAIFPCDSSTGIFAVKGLVWRLRRASDLLDANDSESGVLRVKQVFMCSGIVIIRPDWLSGTLQDILLSALARFCKAAANLRNEIPKITLVLPMLGNNRFEELLRTVLDVQILGDCELEKLDELARSVSIKTSNITVIMTQLKHSARGMRPLPSLVPEGTYRIRIGSDTTVADLTVALKSEYARERPISLDFGGEASEISRRSLAGALVSLIMCSVVGQSQVDAEVVRNQIFIELAASSREDAIHKLPILSVLAKDRFKLSRFEKSEDFQDVLCQSFKTLIDQALQGKRIEDLDVERALLEVFDSKASRPLRPGTPTPFVHTVISLNTMGIVAYRTHCQLKACVDSEGFEGSFPVLLSGDTGTGKTYLLFKFLELLRNSGAVPSLDEKVNIYTISANFERLQVEKLGKKIRERIRSTQVHSSGGTAKVSLFILDEMTGSPAQEALGRLLCCNEISDGERAYVKLPNSSFILHGTCNPDPDRDSVFPLTKESIIVSIDVPRLTLKEETSFTKEQLSDPNRGPGFKSGLLEQAVLLIQMSRTCVESSNPRIGTVSLRDAVRCAALAKRLGSQSWQGMSDSFFDVLEAPEEGWCIDQNQDRALVLACYICYGMRVIPRSSFFLEVQKQCRLQIEQFILQVKSCIVKHFTFASFVVMTPALQDNILAAVVAISARLPLLCLGCDGTSKTLSINTLLSQMQGRFSKSKLLQRLAKAQAFNLQLSEQSTAGHIIKLKKTVISWESDLSIPVIFMEEMSMADMGPTGPLRALHDLLDSHQEGHNSRFDEIIGTGSNSFGFLATSNYGPGNTLPVGRALGNRLLILAHETLPVSSLVELAVSVGMQGVAEKDANLRKAREAALASMLSSLLEVSSGAEPLVPNLISIRSLLYFSRALAMSLSIPNLSAAEAQVRAFSAHLQRVTREQTETLWKHVGRALQWRLDAVRRPSVHDIVEDSFGPCRTRRPLLFLYQSPEDVFKAVSITMKLYKKAYLAMEEKDDNVEFKKVCPTVRRLTRERVAHGRLIDGAESLFALIQLRSAVEKGGLITILNPEPIIEGIHALLNDAGSEHSTLQLRQSHENVRIHPATQIVLLVERSSALGMHSALLSRVAVVNSGMFRWSDTDSNEGTSLHHVSAHSSLMRFYTENTVSDPTEVIMKEESRLLKLCESAFDDLIENLLVFEPSNVGTGVAESYGRLVITLIPGRVPVMQAHDPRVLHIEVVKYNTPALFFRAVIKAVEQLEVNAAVRSPLLLIDLTAAESVSTVECLVLMGFAGVRFSTVACDDALSRRLMQLAARSDRRVVIALDVSRAASCLPAKYRAWAPAADSPKPPKVSDLVSIVEVREMSRSYQDWPSLIDLAQEPALLWGRAVNAVAEQISSVLGGDVLSPEERSLRTDIADLALRYCTPEAQCVAALCPSPKIDLGESALSREQLQTARMHLFYVTSKKLLAPDRRASFQSLRSGLIEACRTLSYKAAAILLQRVPNAFIARPNKDILVFVRRILATRTFPWQNQDYFVSKGAFQDHALYAQISCAPKNALQQPADFSFPFLRDLLNVLKITLNGDIRVIDTPDNLKNALEYAFPTLKGGLNLRALGPLFSAALVEDLVRRYGPQLTGSHIDTAKQWLTQASDGTLHGILYTFYKSEGLLAVATFLKRADERSEPGAGDSKQVGQGKSLESLAIVAVLECVDSAVRPKSWHASTSPSFFRAVQRVISAWERSEPSRLRQNVNRIKQILLLSGLHAPAAAGAAAQDALRIACDALDGGAGVLKLIPRGLEPGRALLIVSALDNADEISPLPMDSIAAAVVALGPFHGRSLLASTALRREGGSPSFQHVLDFLRTALRTASPAEIVGMCEETAMAAAAVRKICVRYNVSALQAAEFTLGLQMGRQCLPWEALCLAVGAYVLPAGEFLDQVIGQRRNPRFRELANLFFDPGLAGRAAEPLQKFLVRCLVARLDENGLPRLAGRLPQLVGDWIAPFLVRFVEGPMAGLVALPDFDRLLGDSDLDEAWPDALHQAVAGRPPGDPPPAWQRQVVAAAEDEGLAFCRLVVAAWCFLLRLRAPTSVLSSDAFRNGDGMNGLPMPASREGAIEMMRRLGPQLGVTSINRCPCGHVYGIGHCGQPMETRLCPDCRRPIGGADHQWVGGQNQGVADGEDLVRGVPLDWYCAGAGYTERDLQPLEYRVLSLLLLIPLAVFSPRAADRRRQLRRHWDAFREVAGLTSDTDAQHFLLGLLARCLSRGARALPGLAMAGIALRGPGERAEAERVFSGAFRELFARAAPRAIVAEVQESLEESEAGKPLLALREGVIAALDAEDAARRFAPAVLRLTDDASESSSGADERLGQLRKEVALSHESFPVLARCLFDEDSPEATPALIAAADLGAAKRLQCLPDLVDGFKLLHQRAAALVEGGGGSLDSAGNAEAALEAMYGRSQHGQHEGVLHPKPTRAVGPSAEGEAAVRFRDAWQVCRYGQRVECQDVPDLGDLAMLGLGDMVLVAEPAGADGLSRAETLLGGLIESHNAGVRALLASDRPTAEEEGSGEGTTVRLWDAAGADLLPLLLVPWRKAREWVEAELIAALPPGCCRAEVVEPLVRNWLSQRQGSQPALLTLDGWPRVAARVQSGAVRVTVVEQKASIPVAAREALEDWVRQHGLLRDRVTLSLECIQRVAARVERAGLAGSPETPIDDLLRDFFPTQQATPTPQQSASAQQPSPLREMVAVRPARLRARHLNALQEVLAGLIDARPEDALGPAYRVDLPPPAAAALIAAGAGTDGVGAAAAQARLAVLQRRLVGLAEMLARDGFSPAHSMADYLAFIEDDGDDSEYGGSGGDDVDGWLGLMAGLRLEHTYHALVQVRRASAA